MDAKELKKALGPDVECAVEGKMLTITYPSLDAYSKRAQADMTAIEKLCKVTSSEVTSLAALVVPKTEHQDSGAPTGPQKLVVRFL